MDPLLEKFTAITKGADWDSDEDESFFAAIDEVREQAKAEFAFDRLQSYYLAHRDILKPAAVALERASSLLDVSPAASLVFAITSAEVYIKNVILRPMTYGFVHQEYVAKLISDLTTLHSGWDRLKDLLKEVLRAKVGIDLYAITIEGSTVRLWLEFNEFVAKRNAVVHRAEDIDRERASTALKISEQLFTRHRPQAACKYRSRSRCKRPRDEIEVNAPVRDCGRTRAQLARVRSQHLSRGRSLGSLRATLY